MESNIIHTCDPTLTFPIADFELDLLIILISACLNNSTIKEYYSIKIIISNQIQLIQYTYSSHTCIYNQLIQYTHEYMYVHVCTGSVCTCVCSPLDILKAIYTTLYYKVVYKKQFHIECVNVYAKRNFGCGHTLNLDGH